MVSKRKKEPLTNDGFVSQMRKEHEVEVMVKWHEVYTRQGPTGEVVMVYDNADGTLWGVYDSLETALYGLGKYLSARPWRKR